MAMKISHIVSFYGTFGRMYIPPHMNIGKAQLFATNISKKLGITLDFKEIIFLHDASFWGDANTGFCLTEKLLLISYEKIVCCFPINSINKVTHVSGGWMGIRRLVIETKERQVSYFAFEDKHAVQTVTEIIEQYLNQT